MSENRICLDDIQFTEDGRAFIQYIFPKGNVSQRYYGEIRHCERCNAMFFHKYRSAKVGRHCSNRCTLLSKSREDFNSTMPEPYNGSINWSYLAGFFDGEGSLVSHTRGRHTFQVTQVPIEVLNELSKFLLSQGIKSMIYTYQPSRPTHSISHRLYITNMYAIYAVIENIIGLVIVKRNVLRDVILSIEDILQEEA